MKLPGRIAAAVVACLAGTLAGGPLRAENWPQWRGPHFDGSTSETGLPDHWAVSENIAWTAPLPGPSGATPVIWGDSVFLPSADAEGNLWLSCFDAGAGKQRWQRSLGSSTLVVSKNNMATPSAATDGKVVAALAGTGRLAVYDFAGKQLWSRDLAREFGKFAIKFLPASSPLLFGGRLYVQVLQNDRPEIYQHVADDKRPRQSFLLCLDPQSGETLWRQVRRSDAPDESQEAYNTPLPFQGPRGSRIICFGGDYVTGHDPATGAELWRCGSLNEKRNPQWRTISSPVAAGDLVVCCLPRAKSPVVAVSGAASGHVAASGLAWRFTAGSCDVPTPLYYRGKLFVLDDVKNTLVCLDPKTGSKQWSGRLGSVETFSASPTGADGKIYCLGERGTVVVLAAGDEFKVIAKFTMPREASDTPGKEDKKAAGGAMVSSIAAAGGHLFIRGPRTLWCIGPK